MQAKIRHRIKERRWVKASELVPNPKNYRVHPEAQRDALRGVLTEIGDVDEVLARELPDGRLMTIDGHMRTEERGDELIEVGVTDLTEEEADKYLAAKDPLTMMAVHDGEKLRELLGGVDAETDGLKNLFDGLIDQADFAAMQDEALDAEPGAKRKGNAKKPDRGQRMGDRKKQIKPVLYAEQLDVFERALTETGKMNRGEALMEICNAYLVKKG